MNSQIRERAIFISVIASIVIFGLFFAAGMLVLVLQISPTAVYEVVNIFRFVFTVPCIITLGYVLQRNGFRFALRLKGLGKCLLAAFAILLLGALLIFSLKDMQLGAVQLFVILPYIAHQIGVGLFEESLFRGLLMTAMLVKWGDTAQGRLAVALLSGVLFGTCHIINMFFNGSSLQFTLFNLVVAAALGFGFAAMYVYSRNLLGCMIVHAVYDFIANLSSQLPNRLVLLVILGLISLFAIVLCIVAKPFCVGVIPLRKKELKAQE